jgi:hypothetical protein
MRKPRQSDLNIPPPKRAAAKRSTQSRKPTSSRRRPLLMDYRTWLEVTAPVADAAARPSNSA